MENLKKKKTRSKTLRLWWITDCEKPKEEEEKGERTKVKRYSCMRANEQSESLKYEFKH